MDVVTFNEYFTPRAIGVYWEEVYQNQINMLGPAFFATRQKAGLDLKWLKGKSNITASLMPSAFDALPKFRTFEGANAIETEMPFFREAYLIKEKDRQEMLRAQDASDPYLQEVIMRIYDGVSQLVEGARIIPERMIWQLLAPANGQPNIIFKSNGCDYTYNYDPDGDWKASHYTEITTAENKWSAVTTSSPIDDLQAIKRAARAMNGTALNIAIMNNKTFDYLLKSAQIKGAILAQNSTANVILNDATVQNVISTLLGITIIVYDKQYKADDGTMKTYIPDNIVVLAPSGNLGTVWKGVTPEALDLLNSPTADVTVVDNGTTISRKINPLPVNSEIWVSEIVLPTYERMNDVYEIKVA